MDTRTRHIITLLLTPAARFCLKNSIHVQELVELLKQVLVQEAASTIRRDRKRINASKISAMSGIHRRDVTRILETSDGTVPDTKNLIARVISQWESDSQYHDSSNSPRQLAIQTEFKNLVTAISTDLNAGTILYELERTGAVTVHETTVELTGAGAIVQESYLDGMTIAAQDIVDVFDATTENTLTELPAKQLHARTEFDSVYLESVPEVRTWLLKKGAAYHREVRAFLAGHDHDVCRDPERTPCVSVSFGTFGLIKDGSNNGSDT